ncbi:hypothetical protein [Streptomyces sp. NPDC050528]|uniref:hypothetical protein n=1 Tax=unclassified Streptomyces TaxID=2593676 RepID=UPI00379BBFFB
MTTTQAALEPGEARTALVLESVLTTAAAVWWAYLLWPWRNDPYARPESVVFLVVAATLVVTWTWLLRGRRPVTTARLALIAVRGVAVLTASLWLLQEL